MNKQYPKQNYYPYFLENTSDLIINYYGHNKINLLSQHSIIILQLTNVYHSSNMNTMNILTL